MDIKEALSLDGLKYFYTTYIKPLRTRINQLGSAANCTVVNNTTTNIANTVLDGRIGKLIMDKFNGLSEQVASVTERYVGYHNYTGNYGREWDLSTSYYDLGNTRTFDDDVYKASSGNSGITVKKAGNYLIIAEEIVITSTEENLWMKISLSGSSLNTYYTTTAYGNGYTTLSSIQVRYIPANHKVTCQLSKSSDATATAKGEGFLQLVKLW